MRWYILRTLLIKEALRHWADRGGIFLALLLIAAALLLSLFGKEEAQASPFVGGVRICYIDFWDEAIPWVNYLRAHPSPTRLNVRFRPARQLPTDDNGIIVYEQSTSAFQLRSNGRDSDGRPKFQIMVWHPGKNAAVLAPYTEWFWRESLRYFHSQNLAVAVDDLDAAIINPAMAALIEILPSRTDDQGRQRFKSLYFQVDEKTDGGRVREQVVGKADRGPGRSPVEIDVERLEMRGRADERSMAATGLIVFALCFFSVYLLPAFTCEERERGVLLAQVLSPASTREILAAKFLFYPTHGLVLGAVLAAVYTPAVLLRPFFWLSMVTTAVGYLGVGLTIASLARTQRMASMGALCYMLSIALLLFITQRFNIPSIQFFALEFYCPRIIHAALEGTVTLYLWNLLAAAFLAVFWVVLATSLFRERGWQ